MAPTPPFIPEQTPSGLTTPDPTQSNPIIPDDTRLYSMVSLDGLQRGTKGISGGESGAVAALLTIQFLPTSLPGSAVFTQSLPQGREDLVVVSAADVGTVARGQQMPDQQLLLISGAQHFHAFWAWRKWRGGLPLWPVGKPLCGAGPNPRNLGNPPRAPLLHPVATARVRGPRACFRVPRCPCGLRVGGRGPRGLKRRERVRRKRAETGRRAARPYQRISAVPGLPFFGRFGTLDVQSYKVNRVTQPRARLRTTDRPPPPLLSPHPPHTHAHSRDTHGHCTNALHVYSHCDHNKRTTTSCISAATV